ncbi:MAG: DUF1285 domain-containing protein [Alphaproteobacteria bacterium]|nr:DUF1285 domain-containing protein [Alphaproteobacteria bacterium]
MTRGRPINSAEGNGAAPAAGAAMPPLASVCGAFPIRISRDGTWFYHGSPIGRKPLARLFSTILARREDGSYWLSTPYESGTIEVDDVPFVAVLCEARGEGEARELAFTTNLDEVVVAGADHPITMRGTAEEPAPYVLVRPGLEARIARAVFYQLVDLAEEAPGPDGAPRLGVRSAGCFFPLEPAEGVGSAPT